MLSLVMRHEAQATVITLQGLSPSVTTSPILSGRVVVDWYEAQNLVLHADLG
jgi:hypothetical protein